MSGWPFDGAPKRAPLDPDLYDHAKAGEVRPADASSELSALKTLDDVLAALARLSKAGHADYDFDAPAPVERQVRMVGADRGRIEIVHED